MTEEEVKARVLLPFLKSLGIGVEEIALEKTIPLPFGRQTVQLPHTRGRADMICRRGNQYLFVIEAKAEGLDITDDDVRQGVSYASLLRPIPPFVLVSNGSKTRVVDTITCEDLRGENIAVESDFWKNGCKLATEPDLQLRLEALRLLGGYSTESLPAFSLSQVELRMQPLKGSRSQRSKKYIPELFVARSSLTNEFRRFMTSDKTCFALVGEAGVGKTNFMCGLAEDCLAHYLVLFFDAGGLSRAILETIRDDFNWAFSADLPVVEVFRRIQSLAEQADTQVCIFMDAIDEAPAPCFERDLDELVYRLKSFPRIRLCVSCKSGEWGRFVSLGDRPTCLAEALFRPEAGVESPDDPTAGPGPLTESPSPPSGWPVTRFSDEEMDEIVPRYLLFFEMVGGLNARALGDCRSGFMLRIVSEVYAGQALPNRIDTFDVLNKYLDRKMDKLVNRIAARDQLTRIAQVLVEEEALQSGTPGLVDERRLVGLLGLDGEVDPGLISSDILKRVPAGPQKDLIGFYYTRLRDFVVAFMSHDLPSRHGDEFKASIRELMRGPVGQGALAWYSGLATDEQKALLCQAYESLALVFLSQYEGFIDSHFSSFKKEFDPGTEGPIGIAVQADPTGSFIYHGFRPMKHEDDDRVAMVGGVLGERIEDTLRKHGAKLITGCGWDRLQDNPADRAKELVCEQLGKILTDGWLDESHSESLLVEKITAVAYSYHRALELDPPPRQHYHLRRVSHLFPLDLRDLQRRVGLALARQWFEREDGHRYMRVNRTNIIPRMDLDWDTIEAKSREEVRSKEIIPDLVKYRWFPPFSATYAAIERLLQKTETISEPILPQPDILPNLIGRRLQELGKRSGRIPDEALAEYSDEQLQRYFQAFFEIALAEYCFMVERNFPALLKDLALYSAMPIEVRVFIPPPEGKGCEFAWAFRPTSGDTNTVSVMVDPPATVERTDVREGWRTHYGGMAGFFESQYGLHGIPPVQPRMPIPEAHGANRMCPLRGWVYRRLRDDLRKAGWLTR